MKAVIEKNWLPESSVPARFPHNSVVEREIKTFQEIARSLFLQAGFAARPQLWLQACSYVATATSAVLKDSEGEMVETDDECVGQVSTSSAQPVMKLMWLGRISRPD